MKIFCSEVHKWIEVSKTDNILVRDLDLILKEMITEVENKAEGRFIYERLKEFDKDELDSMYKSIICLEVEREKLKGNE